MGRPKGSKNKPKTDAVVEVSPVVKEEVAQPDTQQTKRRGRPPGIKNKAKEEPAVSNVVKEDKQDPPTTSFLTSKGEWTVGIPDKKGDTINLEIANNVTLMTKSDAPTKYPKEFVYFCEQRNKLAKKTKDMVDSPKMEKFIELVDEVICANMSTTRKEYFTRAAQEEQPAMGLAQKVAQTLITYFGLSYDGVTEHFS